MTSQREFWRRPVTDKVSLELAPGERPLLQIIFEGKTVLSLEFSDARKLIEALTVAVGELLILKKDPAALAQVQRLLAEDVTLGMHEATQSPEPVRSNRSGYAKGQELVRQYREGRRDFEGADLCWADLQGADLRGVDLSGADLSYANLRRANLSRACLKRTNLAHANLDEAGLFQADLQGADLCQANLHRAYLSRANLQSARVTREQLAEAQVLPWTVMPDGTRHRVGRE